MKNKITLLEALCKEKKILEKAGFKPKFKGDTGLNIAEITIKYGIEPRDQHDVDFVETFKQIQKG